MIGIILHVFKNEMQEKRIEMIKNNEYDLVLCDIKMPKMDGVSLARQIKRDFKNVKVIVLSMFDQPDVINKMIDVDVDGYILKTSSLDELVTAIGEYIRDRNISISIFTGLLAYLMLIQHLQKQI